MAKPYIVSWEIEIDADSPEEAAQTALDIQRDPTSLAVAFDVTEPDTMTVTPVDLYPGI